MLASLARNFWRGAYHVCVLSPVAQGMVDQYQGQHGFGDGRSANAYARVMSAMGLHERWLTRLIDGAARKADAGSGFYGDMRHNILSSGNAAQYAASMVG